jgi:flagellar FliJ protein
MQSLSILLEREEQERDAALAALHAARSHADAARAQAEQLVEYRAEYQRRWTEQFARAGAIEIVHCYQGFTQRLEQAIVQQDRLAQHAKAQAERAQATLAACELRVASVRKLIERRLHEQQRVAARREQKITDEAAQRAAYAGSAARLAATN